MWFPPIIQALCFLLAGSIAAVSPESLSGYDLLPRKWRASTDLATWGRFSARLLCLCAAVSLTALALTGHKTAYAITLCLPIPVLLGGWAWYLRKHKTPEK